MKRFLFFLFWACAAPCCFAQAPVADFSASPTSGCAPRLVNFTDLSTNSPTAWLWDLGNGTFSTLQNPSTTYFTPGIYTVTLTATNGSGSNTKTATNYIEIFARPTVNFFTADSAASCAPKTVNFTNLSTNNAPGSASYLWDFGDGNTSTLANPSHTYQSVGVYAVTLTVTNAAGCLRSFTKSAYITAVQTPSASFISIPNILCTVPAVVNFSNTSSGASSYYWDFGDGGSSIATSPAHTYNTVGNYNVMLIAINGTGCSDTTIITQAVNVAPANAAFTFTNNNQCSGTPINFTANVTPAGGTYAWNFGDGNTSSLSNPTHSYATGGAYNVTLIYSTNDCADTATQTVTVAPQPTANFSVNNPNACLAPHTVNFTNTSANAASYQWTFGDGGSSTAVSPSHTYSALGSYTVRLIATSAAGCSDTFIAPNAVVIAPVTGNITATPQGGCAPLTVAFAANASGYTIASYNWDFGNSITSTSASPSATYSTVGTYTVTLNFVTTSGCAGTATTTITVSPTPTAAFNAPSSACTNQGVIFTNNSTGATSYYWTFGDGATSTLANPTHAYNTPGNYIVTLYAINGLCSTLVTQPITIIGPIANFSYTVSCTNRLQVSFSNASTPGNYLWDFGDATSSTATSPIKTYSAYGSYNVMLTVTDPVTNCQSFHNVTVNLFPLLPAVLVDDSTLCLGQIANFTSLSNNSISVFTFDFGDGSLPVSTSSPVTSHTYSSSGIYNIKLVLTDIYGCKDSVTKQSYVQVGGAQVDFSSNVQNGCSPLPVTFTNLTTSSVYPIVNYAWQFGDGSTSSAQNPNHIYQLPGQYTVTLTVTDSEGCVSTLSKNLYINISKPIANFTAIPTATCVNSVVQFNNTSQGTNLTYDWNFGDGNSSTTINPTHVYTAVGSYNVRLIATDANGCKDTFLFPVPITINQTTAGFVTGDTLANCPPLIASFTSTSINANVFEWDFGNGSTSTQPNTSTTFTNSGTYVVRMIAKDSISNCVDTAYQTVIVNGPTGTFSHSPNTGCTPLVVNYVATATGTSQYIWDMDNGSTIMTTSASLTYTYTQPGTFVPRLILSDANACTYAVVGDSILVDQIVADMQAVNDSVCLGISIQFQDTIINTESAVSTVLYQFGDGNTSTSFNPTHLYANPGTYTVTFIVTNASNCSDTVTRQVVIHPKPNVALNGNTAVCNGVPVALNATGASSYIWSPSTGLSCTSCPNPVASPSATTTYQVIGTSAFGCLDTASVTITVYSIPVISVTPPVDTICAGESSSFTVSGANTYTWSPAAGLSCTNCANPTASPLVTTTYTVVGNSAGCLDTAQAQLVVLPKPVVTLPAQTDICIGASTTLDAGTGATSFNWFPSAGLSCTNCQTPVATPANTTSYTVIGLFNNGCADTASTQVIVHALPQVNAGPDAIICEGVGYQLNASGAQSYSWLPTNNLSCNNCPDPIATPSANITYTVEGTDQWGCKNQDDVRLSIMPHVPTQVGPGDTICRGEQVKLTASGGLEYRWSPAAGLNRTNGSTVSAMPAQTTTYTVVIKENDCYVDSHQVTVVVSPTPQVTFNPDLIKIAAGDKITLQPILNSLTTGLQHTWLPTRDLSCYDCPNPIANAVEKVTYQLIVKNEYGCSDTANITLDPSCSDLQLFMPNTFTPNGDLQNDWFYPMGKGIRIVRNFIIYNRWGELVFQRQNFQPNADYLGWDGTFKRMILPPDVFVYYLEAECTAGEIIQTKGDITLFR